MKTSRQNTLITRTLLACGLTVLIAPYALADVTLHVDDNVKVTVINGKEVNRGLLSPVQQTFTLQPGKHVITARYDRMYKLGRDDHDIVKSGDVTVTADMQDNMTYRLAMPGQPDDYEDARRYAKNPTLSVMQDNRIVAKKVGAEESSGGLFSGITNLFGGSSAKQTNQQAIAAVDAPAHAASMTTTGTPARNNASTLDQFMQLWLQATPEERAKIRQWVQE